MRDTPQDQRVITIMIRQTLKFLIPSLGALLLLLSCPSPVDSLDEKDDVAGFKAFYLSPDINGNLSEVVIGDVNEDSVVLMVPGNSDNSRLSPSFDTDAETVMVGNQQQWSGQSWLDFSEPVEYTLISKGGKETDVTVSVVFTGSWNTLGSSFSGYDPQFIWNYDNNNLIISFIDGSMIGYKYFNSLAGDLVNIGATFGGNVLTFAAGVSGNIFLNAYYNNSTLDFDFYYTNYDSSTYTWTWTYSNLYTATAPTTEMQLFPTDSSNAYLLFTDNATRYPYMVHQDYFNYITTLLASPEIRAVSSFRGALSSMGLIAAATYLDDTGTIYLYQYIGTAWNHLASLPISNLIVKDLIYDDWNGRFIIVAASPNSSNTSRTDINVYSCDINEGSWETLIDPLILNVPVADTIEVAWGNESVLVATRQDCYETSDAGWVHLGGGPYYDSPAPYFSVAAESEGSRRYIAYTDTSGFTYLRYLER